MVCSRAVISKSLSNVTYRTPELRIITSRNNSALSRRSKYPSNFVKYADELLCILAVESVLGCLPHRDDEDVAIIAIKSHCRLVDDGFRHFSSLMSVGLVAMDPYTRLTCHEGEW